MIDVAALMAAVTAARLRSVPIVWTIHNLEPHKARRPWLAHPFMRWLVRRVDGWISLSRAGAEAAIERFPVLADRQRLIVPHGHYADWYGPPPTRSEARDLFGLTSDETVLLTFGRIRPYKRVPDLISAFRRTSGPNLRLIVAGEPASGTGRVIKEAAGEDRRIMLRLGLVSDDLVTRLFATADGFVLPARRLLNSGSALLALSYGVPVLVPDTPVMREMRSTLSPNSVHLHSGGVTPERLEVFLNAIQGFDRQQLASVVHKEHGWSEIGRATADLYSTVIDSCAADGTGG